jgi:dTDP-4-dehydrorhamnose reductase
VNDSLVTPVPSSEYPTKAVRPEYSVLAHTFTIAANEAPMREWKKALLDFLPLIEEAVLQEDN